MLNLSKSGITEVKEEIISQVIKVNDYRNLRMVYCFANELFKSKVERVNIKRLLEETEEQKRIKAYSFIESLPKDELDNVIQYFKSMKLGGSHETVQRTVTVSKENETRCLNVIRKVCSLNGVQLGRINALLNEMLSAKTRKSSSQEV